MLGIVHLDSSKRSLQDELVRRLSEARVVPRTKLGKQTTLSRLSRAFRFLSCSLLVTPCRKTVTRFYRPHQGYNPFIGGCTLVCVFPYHLRGVGSEQIFFCLCAVLFTCRIRDAGSKQRPSALVQLSFLYPPEDWPQTPLLRFEEASLLCHCRQVQSGKRFSLLVQSLPGHLQEVRRKQQSFHYSHLLEYSLLTLLSRSLLALWPSFLAFFGEPGSEKLSPGSQRCQLEDLPTSTHFREVDSGTGLRPHHC